SRNEWRGKISSRLSRPRGNIRSGSCPKGAEARKRVAWLDEIVANGRRDFPSLHCRKERGVGHQEFSRSQPTPTSRGGFPFVGWKTTPSSRSTDTARHFLDRSATPPCGRCKEGNTLLAVRQQSLIAALAVIQSYS